MDVKEAASASTTTTQFRHANRWRRIIGVGMTW